jgi:hypothetical protein
MANTYPPYDPKKAELWNKLRQQGLSEDAAADQAGITSSETENYAIGMNGQLGSFINNSVLSFTAEQIEQNNRNRQFQPVDYDQSPTGLPAQQPSAKPTTYTTTSTTDVSGGGSTTIIDNPPKPTAASQALQPVVDAKQAEIEQFNRDNPSNFLRKKQGLPPLTPEENQQRSEKALVLAQQKQALTEQQDSAKEPVPSTIVTVPNTNTTTTTVTTGNASVGTPVQSPEGADPVINQQTEITIGTTIGNSNKSTDPPPAVDPNSDPNTNTGSEDQDTGYTPLQEPPGVERDEFTGIDNQVAANANGLQEPPQLNEDQVNEYRVLDP